jgi:hypothetical protein
MELNRFSLKGMARHALKKGNPKRINQDETPEHANKEGLSSPF